MHAHSAKNVFSAGRLIQGNSTDGVAIFSGYDLKPGEVRAGTVRIVNAGSLPGCFRLFELDASNDFGAGELILEIADAQGEMPTPLFLGEIGLVPSEGIDLGRFEAGEERAYRFTITCSADAVGASLDRAAGAGYEWEAVSGEVRVP